MAYAAPIDMMFWHDTDYVPPKPIWNWREHFGATARLYGSLDDLRKPKKITGIPKPELRPVWAGDTVQALLEKMLEAQFRAFQITFEKERDGDGYQVKPRTDSSLSDQ